MFVAHKQRLNTSTSTWLTTHQCLDSFIDKIDWKRSWRWGSIIWRGREDILCPTQNVRSYAAKWINLVNQETVKQATSLRRGQPKWMKSVKDDIVNQQGIWMSQTRSRGGYFRPIWSIDLFWRPIIEHPAVPSHAQISLLAWTLEICCDQASVDTFTCRASKEWKYHYLLTDLLYDYINNRILLWTYAHRTHNLFHVHEL